VIFGQDRMIIRELGEFSSIRSPAKCAARIGQTFSDTPITVKIDPNVVWHISDVERNGRVFSDGVGTMSSSLMYKIWDILSKASFAKPTCFQIRYAGKPQCLLISGIDRVKDIAHLDDRRLYPFYYGITFCGFCILTFTLIRCQGYDLSR
jgi:hypothetical protein